MKKEVVKRMLNLNSDLDLVKVEETIEKGNKVLYVYIKSKKKKARCTKCNNFSCNVHDKLKPSKVLYLNNSKNKTYLIAYKRRFKCKTCNKTFTEDLGISNEKGFISLEVKRKVLKDFMNANKSIYDIAIENNISQTKARNIFEEATANYSDRVKSLPEVLSFDETSTKTEKGLYSFILNDPIHTITLDILPSREKDFLISYFTKIDNRKSVKVVICDLYKPYYQVVKICFPKAIFVADPFHYTRYVTQGLDNVRIRLMHEYEDNKKSNEYYLLKNRVNKGLLLKTFMETKAETKKRIEQEEQYNKGQRKDKPKDKFNDYWYGKIKVWKNKKMIEVFRIDRLFEILEISNELNRAYILKEDFLRIKNNVKYSNAKKELLRWINDCYESQIPEMISAAETINNWLDEIVNSFKDERYSNGFTEANNNKIDKIISVAYGYKNFDFFRKMTLIILRKSYSGGSRKISKSSKK